MRLLQNCKSKVHVDEKRGIEFDGSMIYGFIFVYDFLRLQLVQCILYLTLFKNEIQTPFDDP